MQGLSADMPMTFCRKDVKLVVENLLKTEELLTNEEPKVEANELCSKGWY